MQGLAGVFIVGGRFGEFNEPVAWAAALGPNLPGAFDQELVRAEFREAHGAAGMEAVGADAWFAHQ